MKQFKKYRSLMKTNVLVFLLLTIMSSIAIGQPTFSKEFSPSTIGPGSSSRLTFIITNNDAVNPVQNLAFTDMLPAGVVIATPSNAYSHCINGLVTAPEGGSTITLTSGRVSTSTTCTVTVDVTSAVPGTHTNTSGDLTSDAGNSGTASANLTVDTSRPGFSKSFSPSNVAFGDRTSLTFTVDNSASSRLISFLSFTDLFPKGLIVANPVNVVDTCNGTISHQSGERLVSYTGGFVSAGTTCTITLDVIAVARGELKNTSTVLNATILGQNKNSGFSGDVLNVSGADEVLISHEFIDDAVNPGDTVTVKYTLTSINRRADITGISFTNDLGTTLAGLTATGLPLSNVCGSGSTLSNTNGLTLSDATLAPEQICSFEVTLQVPPNSASGIYPNVINDLEGTSAGMLTNGNVSTDALFVTDAPVLTKTFLVNPVGSGGMTTLEYTITNSSTTLVTSDINFTDNMDSFISASNITNLPASNFCGVGSTLSITIPFINDKVIQVTGASLPAGGSCTFSVDVELPAGTPAGLITSTSSEINGTINGSTQVGMAASADLTVVKGPRLTKQFINDPVAPDGNLTLRYMLSLDALVVSDASGINFTDDLNAALTGLSATGLPINDVCGAGSQISGTTSLSLTGASLSPGATCSFDVNLQIPTAALPGSYLSESSNVSATVAGVATTSSFGQDTLIVSGLEFSKSYIENPALPGGTVTLEFSIGNSSPSVDVTGISFTDNLNDSLSGLVVSAATQGNFPMVDVCGTGSLLSLTGTSFLSLTGGNLTANSSCTFSVTLDIPNGTADGDYINATSELDATVAGTPISIVPATESLVVNSRRVSLSKSFTNDPVSPGDTTILEYTLTNLDATSAVTDLNFTDDLDGVLSGLVAIGLPNNDVCGIGSSITGAGVLSFSGGNLAAAASCTFSITLQVPNAAVGGVFSSTSSSVSGTLAGLAISGDPAIDDLLLNLVEFSMAFGGAVESGQEVNLEYTINNTSNFNGVVDLRFTNDLNNVLPGLVVTGALPTEPCGVGSNLSGTSLIELTGGRLDANQSCTFSVMVLVPSGLNAATLINTTSDLFVAGVPVSAPASAALQITAAAIVVPTVIPVLNLYTLFVLMIMLLIGVYFSKKLLHNID